MEWEAFDPICVGRLIPLAPYPYSLTSDVNLVVLEGHHVPQRGGGAAGILSRGWHSVSSRCRFPSEPEKGAAGQECGRQLL